MSTLWRQSTFDHKDALQPKLTAHKTTLSLSVAMFACVCFVAYAADSTVCVYIVY